MTITVTREPIGLKQHLNDLGVCLAGVIDVASILGGFILSDLRSAEHPGDSLPHEPRVPGRLREHPTFPNVFVIPQLCKIPLWNDSAKKAACGRTRNIRTQIQLHITVNRGARQNGAIIAQWTSEFLSGAFTRFSTVYEVSVLIWKVHYRYLSTALSCGGLKRDCSGHSGHVHWIAPVKSRGLAGACFSIHQDI